MEREKIKILDLNKINSTVEVSFYFFNFYGLLMGAGFLT